jgi:nucleotide-binding universal stress UspA family protein
MGVGTVDGAHPTRTEVDVETRPNGPVVVGVDGSANSRHALVRAGLHARSTGAALVVVHAIGLTEEIGGEHVPAFGRRNEIAALLDRWCDAVREIGITDFDQQLIDGSPVDVLLRVAIDVGAGTVVIGRRGIGGRPELLLGSTAHQVIEHARCPVLVIPPPDGGDTASTASA